MDELQEAFARLQFPPLQRRTLGHFFTVYDSDQDDLINLDEFRIMYEDVTNWRGLFDGIRGQGGAISTEQAAAALKLPEAMVPRGEAGLVMYDAFIEMCLVRRAIIMAWEAMPPVDGHP